VAPGGFADAASGPLISADIGLYLFILGAGVLAVIGYQLFLAAARASVARLPLPQRSRCRRGFRSCAPVTVAKRWRTAGAHCRSRAAAPASSVAAAPPAPPRRTVNDHP